MQERMPSYFTFPLLVSTGLWIKAINNVWRISELVATELIKK